MPMILTAYDPGPGVSSLTSFLYFFAMVYAGPLSLVRFAYVPVQVGRRCKIVIKMMNKDDLRNI